MFAERLVTSEMMRAAAAAPPMSPVAVRLSVVAVIVPDDLMMASADVRFMVPAAEKLESMMMSLPAPVVVRFMLGAVMVAPEVASVPPTVRSNRVPADEAPSVTPDASVMKTLAPVLFADRLVTSVKIWLAAAAAPMSPPAVRLSVVAVMLPDVRVMVSAALRLMVPVAEKLELMTMSLPAPVTERLMFGAEIEAPDVLSVPPAVKSKRVAAPEAPRATPDASVMKTLAPVAFAERLVTSVNTWLAAAAAPMFVPAVMFSVLAVTVPEVREIESAAFKLMVPVAEKLESRMIPLPAPVVVRLMFGAVMPAPEVFRVPPAVRSNKVPADEAPRVTPEASVT